MKTMLETPSILIKPTLGNSLLVYLSISDDVISVAIIQEWDKDQQVVYFVSKSHQGGSDNRPNGPTHQIGPTKVGPSWQNGRRTIQLFKFNISFERKGHIKAKALANFMTKLASIEEGSNNGKEWFLSIDRVSNQRGSGAGVILEGFNRVLIKKSLCFEFKTSNN
ncbi:hypothetical protein CR513_62641, partial [Mucuna pruriens]